ncbi:hypothetical protein LCGC14_1509200 [marine sediment metagenome]|uniref:Uncharacterized protein n=1 Tax=marine sediment metagenome TaxID=412755 RepID=A0A0F9LH92_9ZZZZ
MKLYIAGNFPQMKDPELELECAKLVIEQTGEYNRLVSFWFEEDVERVIEVKKEVENNG